MARPNSTQASSFTCFSKLPREIQLSIWEYSLPPPRMIHISAQAWQFASKIKCAGDRHKHVWLEGRPVPAILHASADSREAARKHYKLILDTTSMRDFSRTSVSKRKRRPAYVDLARDILVTKSHFHVGVFLEFTPQTVLNRIRYFAYSDSYQGIYGGLEFKELIKSLPALDGLAGIYDRIRGVGYRHWRHEQTASFFEKLKNDRETVLKIRTFGHEKDLEKALQYNKLWDAESEVAG
jgi:hypothetical protein